MQSVTFTIQNEEGLHARPATDFCETAMAHESSIRVRRKDEEESFDAKSIISLLSLGAVKGETIEITADGPDEEAALKALVRVLENA
ncbi:MAG: HPr family phosphocarrier protein [Christensenellales bacterium]